MTLCPACRCPTNPESDVDIDQLADRLRYAHVRAVRVRVDLAGTDGAWPRAGDLIPFDRLKDSEQEQWRAFARELMAHA